MTPCSTAFRLTFGFDPGNPRQMGQVLVLGSASPCSLRSEQNILLFVLSCTCASIPIITLGSITITSFTLQLCAYLEQAALHEVVAHVPEEGTEDQIVDELEPGYMLHDRLLRAAKVRIVVALNKIAAATDPTLADAFACSLMDRDPMTISYIRDAAARKLGSADILKATVFKVKV